MSVSSVQRSVLHLDLDTFFVSVERRKDARLQGLPLIIGGTGDRAVVSACSYEARVFGIRSAMPMRIAKRLCPHGFYLSGDVDAYLEQSRIITEIVREKAPLYEKASIDEFYVEMTGMERFYGCYQWGQELRQYIMKETGLPLSLGLSVNKLVSKIATNEAKPNGALHIIAPEIEPFLAPMPVYKIPQIGPKTSRTLAYLGVRSVATLRQIPADVLERAFGRQGQMLYRRSRGQDDSPVRSDTEQQSMSSEQTFAQDTIDLHLLQSTIVRMTEALAFRLRQQDKLTACISVKLRYANFETVSRQARISYTARDELLIDKALHIFERLYQKRVRVRLIGVRLSHLVYGGAQLALFQDLPRQSDLYMAIDAIKSRYGGGAVRRASGIRHLSNRS
ncbi:MAG: DNA polymerase IV [Bacteroidota bacterium]